MPAPHFPTDEAARRVYESLSTPDLLEMYIAFALDLANGAEPAFCHGRLALIRDILLLRERN